MRRIKNWKTWISESLEQNPFQNLPDGVTMHEDPREARHVKLKLFGINLNVGGFRVDNIKKLEWKNSESDYQKIANISQKYNFKLTIKGSELLIESLVGGDISITRLDDEYYWVEKHSAFLKTTDFYFEVDQTDALLNLLFILLNFKETSPEGVEEIIDESEINKYHNQAWHEIPITELDDWKGNWTDEEIAQISSSSDEIEEIFTNHYNFYNGIFEVYTMRNSFVLIKLNENEYWIEKDESGTNTKKYYKVTGIDNLKNFLKLL